MNISDIVLVNFLSHDQTAINLPKRGVVVLTGANGAGKSSVVEAVAYGLWGQTLRGTSPWREGVVGRLMVVSDRATVQREVTAKGATKLMWIPGEAEPGTLWTSFDTQKKAADALAEQVGDIDLWRRTHVFSSQDAMHFTMATDGDRKHLLESLLGLGKFDLAATRCSEARLKAKSNLSDVNGLLLTAAERMRYTQAAVSEFDSESVESEPTAPEAADASAVAAAKNLVHILEIDVADLRYSLRSTGTVPEEVRSAVTKYKTQLAMAERQHALLMNGVCPTCKQDLVGQLVDQLHEDLNQVQKDLADAQQTLNEAVDHAANAQAELNKVIAERESALGRARNAVFETQRKAAVFDAYKQEHKSWAQRQSGRATRRLTLVRAAEAAEAVVGQLEDVQFDAEREFSELETATVVLGLKGVRAHVLGKALAGIEQIANAWLQRIAKKPLRLELKPYRELKSGGTQDSISLEVVGAGGGLGYKASSGGERRRIDAALLLALAEVASAAYGTKPGTIFVDEVFDALDADGIEAVAEVLAEIALDRCVVVITHDEALARKVPAVLRLCAVDGTIK